VDINITLIVQMLVFAAFVWFTMTFVWPPLTKALEERQNKIADGLAAAERGRRELELAQQRAKDELKKAKADAADIIEKAHHRASLLIEEAKEEARLEVQRTGRVAAEQLAQEVSQARESLRKQVGELAVLCAEKILKREINQKETESLINNLIEEI
jgi:F-type H+-transporting ATPase subunit b